MWAFGVEPHEILHEDDVEFLWLQKIMCMVIYELFLNGSIESFAVRIHLRGSWVRVVVREMQLFQLV